MTDAQREAGAGPEPVPCPHCGAAVDDSGARRHPSVERVGCMECGVQLIRRPGEPWQSIRG